MFLLRAPFVFLLTMAFFTAPCFSDGILQDSILQDTNFQNGFEVMSPIKDIYTDRAEFETIFRISDALKNTNKNQTTPSWRLVQWGSKKSISSAKPFSVPDGGTTWTIDDKSKDDTIIYKRVNITLNNAINNEAQAYSLMLELNGLAEFSGNYLASADQYWPHLLMAQNLKTKKLNEYHSLWLNLDAKLLFDEKNIRQGYVNELHAGRYIVSLAVRNTLSNNSFIINMVVYDDRQPQTAFSCKKCRDKEQQDCYVPTKLDDPGKWSCPFDGDRWSKTSEKKGTRRMIFRLPTSATTQDNIQDGDWVRYRVDLLPYIKAGLDAAQADETLRGFLPSLKYCDISFFSMGWEMTGLNHAAIEIKNLSLIGL